MSDTRFIDVPKNKGKPRWLAITLIAAGAIGLAQVGGCYYLQAASGQLELMRKREPIDDVIAAEDTPPELRARLRLVEEARQFAVDELRLPDNESYRSFADLERDYVVWNVFAAPEFSLEPRTWCYPVVGCVAYRGYFAEESARRHADRLRVSGFDVHVGGVAAYSTLGRFSDPVLNTMMRWSDAELVAVLFHELAHQRLFIKGDTAFNESFATAVAEIGLERWLGERGQQNELEAYRRRVELQEALTAMAEQAKQALGEVYAAELDDDGKRARKREILDALSSRAGAEALRRDLPELNFLKAPLNNARLVPLGLYRGYLGAFRALLASCGGELACFYRQAEAIAALPDGERAARLAELAAEFAADGSGQSAAAGAGAGAARTADR